MITLDANDVSPGDIVEIWMEDDRIRVGVCTLTKGTAKVEAPVIAVSAKHGCLSLGWKSEKLPFFDQLATIGANPDFWKGHFTVADIAEYRLYSLYYFPITVISHRKAGQAINAVALDGLWCRDCRTYFPYAAANQNDGTLKCWSCRAYPFYHSTAEDD
jgi:hypothetical protein